MASSEQLLALSQELANVVEQLSESVVAVHGGHRVGASGIHWRSGLIVTARHAIRHGEEFSITLPDHGVASAALVGRDSSTDLALLKTDAKGLATVQTSTTAGLKVGHLVIAVGRSHLGDLAASTGVVARLGGPWRTWRGGQIDQLLRPDITLYRGQSGSALVNVRGEVLGMNTGALARMAAITVPASTVDRVITELLEHGHVRRAYLGIAMQTVALPDTVRAKLKLESATGLLVMHVESEGPGSKAGLMVGDLMIRIQDKVAADLSSLQEALAGKRPEQTVKLTIIRGGEERGVDVTLGDRPSRK